MFGKSTKNKINQKINELLYLINVYHEKTKQSNLKLYILVKQDFDRRKSIFYSQKTKSSYLLKFYELYYNKIDSIILNYKKIM